MLDTELLIIWFSSVIGAAILTMLMPRMVSASGDSEVTQDMGKRKGKMVLVGNQSHITSSLSRYLHRNVSYLVFIDYCVREPAETDGSNGLEVARP